VLVVRGVPQLLVHHVLLLAKRAHLAVELLAFLLLVALLAIFLGHVVHGALEVGVHLHTLVRVGLGLLLGLLLLLLLLLLLVLGAQQLLLVCDLVAHVLGAFALAHARALHLLRLALSFPILLVGFVRLAAEAARQDLERGRQQDGAELQQRAVQVERRA